MDAPTMHDLKAFVAAKAGDDAAFRASLLADPKAAVARLLDLDLPAHVAIRVVEEAPDAYVVVLPAPAAGELSDADLESVAGGASKADQRKIAQHTASAIFGAGAAAGALLVGEIANAAGDRDTRNKAKDAGASIVTCGDWAGRS